MYDILSLFRTNKKRQKNDTKKLKKNTKKIQKIRREKKLKKNISGTNLKKVKKNY